MLGKLKDASSCRKLTREKDWTTIWYMRAVVLIGRGPPPPAIPPCVCGYHRTKTGYLLRDAIPPKNLKQKQTNCLNDIPDRSSALDQLWHQRSKGSPSHSITTTLPHFKMVTVC